MNDLKITESSDKKLLLFRSGVSVLIGGIVAIFVGLSMAIILISSTWMSPFTWPLAILAVVGGGYLVYIAKNKQITLLKGGLSEIVESAIVGTAEDRQDFRTDSIEAVCFDSSANFQQRNPSSGKPNLLSKIRQDVLFLKLADQSEILLTQVPSVTGYQIKNIKLPAPKTSPLLDQARTIALFLGKPLRDITLPDASAIFGETASQTGAAGAAATAATTTDTDTPSPAETVARSSEAADHALPPEIAIDAPAAPEPDDQSNLPPSLPVEPTEPTPDGDLTAPADSQTSIDQAAEAAMNEQLAALERQSEALFGAPAAAPVAEPSPTQYVEPPAVQPAPPISPMVVQTEQQPPAPVEPPVAPAYTQPQPTGPSLADIEAAVRARNQQQTQAANPTEQPPNQTNF